MKKRKVTPELIEELRRVQQNAYLDRREPYWREHAADDATEENPSHIRRNGSASSRRAHRARRPDASRLGTLRLPLSGSITH
jgi:hypothetical protein